eukprot:GHVS01091907.1.p1 GENE.GHVS01091907.1~~GHVS01091907.1.p1  ORF type:complete len:388 (-),score=99.01 GHVS01091907.1:70-1071(-)
MSCSPSSSFSHRRKRLLLACSSSRPPCFISPSPTMAASERPSFFSSPYPQPPPRATFMPPPPPPRHLLSPPLPPAPPLLQSHHPQQTSPPPQPTGQPTGPLTGEQLDGNNTENKDKTGTSATRTRFEDDLSTTSTCPGGTSSLLTSSSSCTDLFPLTTTTTVADGYPHFVLTTPTLALVMSSFHRVNWQNRLLNAAAYLLPLVNANEFGGTIFKRFPLFHRWYKRILSPLLVLRSLPLFTFLSMTLLRMAASNRSLHRSLRFNLHQALVLDVLEVVGSLFLRLPLVVSRPISTVIFLFVFCSCMYSFTATLCGRMPDRIPFVSKQALADFVAS